MLNNKSKSIGINRKSTNEDALNWWDAEDSDVVNDSTSDSKTESNVGTKLEGDVGYGK